MKVIVKGQSVLIDQDSLAIFNERVWHISDQGYVVWRGIIGGIKRTIRLHRLVIEAKSGQLVDHINRNKLDNRKSNLRIATYKLNVHNSDQYENAKGYYYDNRKKRWTVDFIRYNVRSLYVNSEQEAIKVVNDLKNGIQPDVKLHRRTKQVKLTYKDIDAMLNEYKIADNKMLVAKKYGINFSTLRRYVNGQIGVGYKTYKLTSPKS